MLVSPLSLRRSRFQQLTHPPQRLGERLPEPRGPSADPPARVLPFWLMAASSRAAGTGASTWLLGARFFLAERADDRNQTVNLRLIQGSTERRHIPLSLLDLRVYFGVSQLLGFGRTQILRPDRFSDDRISGSIRAVALGAVCVEQFLAVRLR